MKQFLHPILLLCLPFLLASCEEGALGPRAVSCLETSQTNSAGVTFEKVYDGDRLIEEHTRRSGELQNYYAYTYDAEGRISESEYVDMQSGSSYAPRLVTYNAKGKWVQTSQGGVYITEAEYDSQNQITRYTYKTIANGTETVNHTVTYEWTGGNNTLRTYTSPTQRTVTRYEYYLDRENRRRSAAEKTAFLSNTVSHNRNMRKRTVSSSTELASGTVTETVTEYDYEYNEAGYPLSVNVTTTVGTAASTVSTTTFEYSCN